jgi:anti-anti-sigma regulatory factor
MFGTSMITTQTVGNVDIIDYSGKLTDEGQGAALLEDILTKLTTKFANAQIVVNMARVTEIDAAGIAALEKGRRNGGDVKLLNIGKRLPSTQGMMLGLKFRTFTDQVQAIRSWEDEASAARGNRPLR